MTDFRSQQMTEHTPTPWGLWSEEGFTKSGKALYSICANGTKPAPNGDLDVIAEYEGNHEHFCVAEVRGNDEDHAHANAAFIVEAVNSHETLKARIRELEAALNTSRVALMTIRGCSIVGAERGYGQPELWADNLFRSHGDVATALKVIDAALSKGAA